MIDLIEDTRRVCGLPPVDYVFFDTGLEMEAIKNHVKETSEKYGVKIKTVKPEIGIVTAVHRYGLPFISKHVSKKMCEWQDSDIPLSIADEYEQAEDKQEKYWELVARYPHRKGVINWLCSCNAKGVPINSQLAISSAKYLLDFLKEYPPDFKVCAKCCDYCKKAPAHEIQKNYDMVITGERMAEGGIRAAHKDKPMCFEELSSGQFRMRPLYYVSDKDKAWYKEKYGIRYSDAYEVYGLTRTGCCGCSINYKATEDLEKIKPYEPNLVKAAWNVFGKSYEYRRKYVEYRAMRSQQDKEAKKQIIGQLTID